MSLGDLARKLRKDKEKEKEEEPSHGVIDGLARIAAALALAPSAMLAATFFQPGAARSPVQPVRSAH